MLFNRAALAIYINLIGMSHYLNFVIILFTVTVIV